MTLQEKIYEFIQKHGSWPGVETDFRIRLHEILTETGEAARAGIPPIQYTGQNRRANPDKAAARDGESRSGRR